MAALIFNIGLLFSSLTSSSIVSWGAGGFQDPTPSESGLSATSAKEVGDAEAERPGAPQKNSLPKATESSAAKSAASAAGNARSTASQAFQDPMNLQNRINAQNAASNALRANSKFKELMASGEYNNEDGIEFLRALGKSVTVVPPKRRKSNKVKSSTKESTVPLEIQTFDSVKVPSNPSQLIYENSIKTNLSRERSFPGTVGGDERFVVRTVRITPTGKKFIEERNLRDERKTLELKENLDSRQQAMGQVSKLDTENKLDGLVAQTQAEINRNVSSLRDSLSERPSDSATLQDQNTDAEVENLEKSQVRIEELLNNDFDRGVKVSPSLVAGFNTVSNGILPVANKDSNRKREPSIDSEDGGFILSKSIASPPHFVGVKESEDEGTKALVASDPILLMIALLLLFLAFAIKKYRGRAAKVNLVINQTQQSLHQNRIDKG